MAYQSDKTLLLNDPTLKYLFSWKAESRFHCVYRHVYPHGGRGGKWRATVFGEHLGERDEAVEAARLVRDLWESVYGAEWPSFFLCRKMTPWFAIKVPPEEIPGLLASRRVGEDITAKSWTCEPAGATACRLQVYQYGRVSYVPPPNLKADVFATEEDAVWFFRRWADAKYGDAARWAIRRAEPPE